MLQHAESKRSTVSIAQCALQLCRVAVVGYRKNGFDIMFTIDYVYYCLKIGFDHVTACWI